MIHYLPGCDVKRNHEEAINKLTNYIKSKNIIIDECCRNKKQFLKDNDTIIYNCTLCDLILNERFPNTKAVSLYEYILLDKDFQFVDHHHQKITIQDCYRMKDNLEMMEAIRGCLKKMNFDIIEMPENRENTKFCGVWLNNPINPEVLSLAPHTMSQMNIQLLSPKQQIEAMEKWNKQYTTKQVVVYCNGCEKGIKLGGGNPIHMVELLSEGIY